MKNESIKTFLISLTATTTAGVLAISPYIANQVKKDLGISDSNINSSQVEIIEPTQTYKKFDEIAPSNAQSTPNEYKDYYTDLRTPTTDQNEPTVVVNLNELAEKSQIKESTTQESSIEESTAEESTTDESTIKESSTETKSTEPASSESKTIETNSTITTETDSKESSLTQKADSIKNYIKSKIYSKISTPTDASISNSTPTDASYIFEDLESELN